MSKTRVYCALSGFFFLLFATVISASAAPRLTTSSEIDEKFITYTDSRFDFSVQYPETWQIIPYSYPHCQDHKMGIFKVVN